jgi:hypothetical protein
VGVVARRGQQEDRVGRHAAPRPSRRTAEPPTVPFRVTGGNAAPVPPAGKGVLVAFTAGAVIAAGESIVTRIGPELPAPAVAAALAPVATIGLGIPAGVGGDRPLPLAAGPDARSAIDVGNLVKAVEIAEELARRQTLLDAALAGGASQAALFGDRAFVQPVVGRVTSQAGPRWGRQHEGLDVANRIGTPIFAVAGGVVVESGPASGFGLWVVVEHADGTRSVYGHINRTFVEVGQEVSAGERIAEVGNRGFSTGPHLHLEIVDTSGEKLDPTDWLRDRGIEY